MSIGNVIVGNTSKAIERHLGSSYAVILYVAQNMDKFDEAFDMMKFFNKYYLGVFPENPTEGLNGEPLIEGMFYLNSTTDSMWFYSKDVNGNFDWYDIEGVTFNVIELINQETDEFIETAESYKKTFQEYGESFIKKYYDIEYIYKQIQIMYNMVSGNVDKILEVLQNINSIVTVADNIDSVNTVADNIDSVNTVAPHVDEIVTVSQYTDAIQDVSNNMSAVVDAEQNALTAQEAADRAYKYSPIILERVPVPSDFDGRVVAYDVSELPED